MFAICVCSGSEDSQREFNKLELEVQKQMDQFKEEQMQELFVLRPAQLQTEKEAKQFHLKEVWHTTIAQRQRSQLLCKALHTHC